jgi:tRNA modification GTPase
MSDYRVPPARVAVLTSAGRGAIAVIRVWGSDAIRVADAAFRPRRRRALATTPPGQVRLGSVGDGLGDEVVAVILNGETQDVEIHCHGGIAAVRLVVDALCQNGAVESTPEDWVRREASSPLSAQAWTDLPRAQTVRTAEILLEQAEGALEKELAAVAGLIKGNDLGGAIEALDRLAARWDIGSRLLTGWRIVLAGRPNVGKSRLLNALAGYDRAIVDATPGTTRDVVTVNTAINGWPVEIADTAGLRATTNVIEAEGVSLARTRQREADLVLLVLDRSEPLTDADRALIESHPESLRVANKADLEPAWNTAAVDAMDVSAEHGDGIDALIAAIGERLIAHERVPGAGVPFRARHLRLLKRARRFAAAGQVRRALIAIRLLHQRSIRESAEAPESG